MLTLAQVRAQVTTIRKRMTNGTPPIAIHAAFAWTGPDRLDIGGVEHALVCCQSDLQVREALLRAEAGSQPLVLLCHLDPSRLGDDVLARLAKRRVFHPQAREVLAELFSARVIDPRVLGCKPLVDALIQGAPKEGYRPVSGGSLDLQTAWLCLLQAQFGENWEGPSLTGLLGWSLDERKLRAFLEMHAGLRSAMMEWFVRSRGEAARFMLTALETGVGPDLIPLGLLVGLLFQIECRGTPEAQSALGRLERFFDHKEIDGASARTWATAAADFIQSATDRATVRPLLAGLDRLLEQTRVSSMARFSRFSPLGLEQRFEGAGRLLRKAMDEGSAPALSRAEVALREIEAHHLAADHVARIRCLTMALRLLGWLSTPGEPNPRRSLSELASDYLATGGFVDWARDSLEESDPVASIREAYQEIVRRVDRRLGPFEEAFADGLHRWCAEGSPRSAVLPIEDVLAEVAAPVARGQPTLLLVLDGMSVAAFRQLLDDLVRRDWVEMGHKPLGLPRPVVAALPTVTEVSRWALLAGRIDRDRRSSEKLEFNRNPALLEAASGQSKPQLFLKGDLTAIGQLGLAPEVQSTIANRRHRMVAVVVNAMDDLLAAGDQIAVTWGMDTIKPLRELLQAARDSERVVLLTSDHGHILERSSRQVPSETPEAGDRYRVAGGPLSEGEMAFAGPRVERAMGETGLVCFVRKDARYQAKRRGYHGGACAQEVVVPLTALRHVATEVSGEWQDLPPVVPAWWNIRPPIGVPPTPPPVPAVRPAPARPRQPGELDLFPEGAPAAPSEGQDWLAALLASDLYKEQVRRAARMPRLQEEVPRLLRVLEARGGSMLRSALAQEIGLPLFRIDGLVQNAGRVLNLDGYEAIEYDRTSETVVLHLDLLRSQFGLS